MNSSRDKIFFWCLIAAEAAGSQTILWNGIPIYRRLLSPSTEGADSKDFVLTTIVVIVMQVAHWVAFRLRPPRNKRQDFQEQSIRDAEIPPDDYYPKGYKPELIPFWPTGKPIFIPADQVPPGLWLHGKPAAAAQPGPDGEAGKSPVQR